MTLLLLGAGGLLGQTLAPYLQSADVDWCTITRGRNTSVGDWVHHRHCPLHGEPGRLGDIECLALDEHRFWWVHVRNRDGVS